MASKRNQGNLDKKDDVIAEIRRERATREKTYREQALKLFPHVCGRCGREFAGVRLRELTVHHKDNNHMNNPPDGSNWELLCLYCHDNEHQLPEERESYEGTHIGNSNKPTIGYEAFAGLKDLFPMSNETQEESEENVSEDS